MPRLIAALTALAVLAPATAARAEWSAPRTVSSPHTFVGPLQLGTGPFATYGWQDGLGRDERGGASASGPAGEAPAPDGLLAAGRYAQTRAIALSQRMVSSASPQRFRVAYAFGSVTGGFGAPHALAVAPTAGRPQLAVAPNGRALAAWIEIHGSRRIVRVAYRPVGGRFGHPTTILGRGQTDTIAVGIGGGNDFAVVAARNGKVIARLRPRLGHWRPVETLARERHPTQWQLALAVDATGHVQAVWRRHEKGRVTAIEAASAVRGHGFGSVQTLEADGAGAPFLLDSPLGWVVAYARWPSTPGGDGIARLHLRRNGHRFGGPLDASPVMGGLRDVTAAVDAGTGLLLAGWLVPTPAGDGGGRGYAALRAFGGAFAAPEAVTPDEAVSEIAFTPARGGGGFTAAWVARPEGTGPGIPIAQVRTVVREADRR